MLKEALPHLKAFKKFYYFDSNHYLLERELTGRAKGLIEDDGLIVHDIHHRGNKKEGKTKFE